MTDYTDAVRFHSKIEIEPESGCWIYKGWKSKKGYGRFWTGGKMASAHRYAFELAYGPIPDGLCVCHACDCPSCVNPEHLWLGNNQDNTDDRENKGRGVRLCGEEHGISKLSLSDVREIRRQFATGKSNQSTLAMQFGVSISQISHIVKGEQWKQS